MLNLKKIKLAVITALFLPAITIAAEPVIEMPAKPIAAPTTQENMAPLTKPQFSAKTSAAANEIADINERLAVLTAKLAELELQSKIASKREEINKVNNPLSTTGADSFVPTVMDIDGVDGKLRASLYVQGGNTQSVRVGDKVGSWKVKEIKMDSVTVQKGKEVVRLGFGSYSPEPTANASGVGIPQLPR